MKALSLDIELRARLRELLELDCTSPSGLRWKMRRRGVTADSPAGSFNKPRGYWYVRVGGKRYLAHRLVWALKYDKDPGDQQVDHIDGDPGNNDPVNLRLATQGENQRNGKRHRDNTSGHKGVCRHGQHAAWNCRVQVHGKEITKCFSDSKYGGTEAALAAAVEWVRATREELHGEFARHA